MRFLAVLLALSIFSIVNLHASEKSKTNLSNEPTSILLDKLRDNYNKIMDIYLEFTQETYHGKVSEPIVSKGKAYLKRPEKMRWEYTSPEKQLILTQGDNIYIYEEEVNQMIVYKKDSFLSKEIQNLFFLKAEDILKKYDAHASDLQEKDFPQNTTIKLTPKENYVDESNFKVIYFNITDEFIKGMIVIDKLDTKTKIIFTKIAINKGIEEKKFSFSPPKDVKIFYYD